MSADIYIIELESLKTGSDKEIDRLEDSECNSVISETSKMARQPFYGLLVGQALLVFFMPGNDKFF